MIFTTMKYQYSHLAMGHEGRAYPWGVARLSSDMDFSPCTTPVARTSLTPLVAPSEDQASESMTLTGLTPMVVLDDDQAAIDLLEDLLE